MNVLRKIFFLVLVSAGALYYQASGQDSIAGNGLQVIRDIEYKKQGPGLSPGLKLDLYRASIRRERTHPVVLFVHGGGFWEGDKGSSLYVKMAMAFARQGYTSISVNYTLKRQTEPYSRNILDHDISDVRAALRWIWENRERLEIDTSKLIICGDSAGGGIVINLSYDSAYCKYFRGCIDLWGGLPGGQGWDAPVYAGNLAGNIPATCIIHGTNDHIVPFQTGWQLSQALSKAGIYYQIHPLQNADHYPVQLADQFIPVMIAFADKVLRRK